ncbi:cell division protein ZipA [Psychromonas sp. MME2]|uniref:cell division protein ZipA n=1 Tax=unclassified Psychromonas TaxID=2614957 RepID=UPI00339C3327
MQYFQPILIVIGVLAIAAVLIHGYLLNRKDKALLQQGREDAAQLSKNNRETINEEGDVMVSLDLDNDPDIDEKEIKVNIGDDDFSTDDFIINDLDADKDHYSLQVDSEEPTDVKLEEQQPVFNEDDTLPIPSLQPGAVHADEAIQDIFIFNVVPKEDAYLRGHTLLQFFLTSGFRFGKMNIFHRHLQSDGKGPILFSIANMVAPGVFDPVKMKQLHSEGVSFFLTAPNDEINIKEAFDMMLVAVQQMTDEFDCIVLNADRELMTEQQFRDYHKRLMRYM